MPVSNDIFQKLSQLFEEDVVHRLTTNISLKSVPEGKIIVEIRDKIIAVPLLLEGRIKVERRDGEGNGVLLHYIRPMEVCPISFFYGFSNKNSDLRCTADTPITYLSIPIERAISWYQKFPTWRDYLARLTQLQHAKLIKSFDDIIFNDLSSRLVHYIQEALAYENTHTLFLKHQDIALDLKVSRETISRILKKMEHEGKLILGRNRITVLNLN